MNKPEKINRILEENNQGRHVVLTEVANQLFLRKNLELRAIIGFLKQCGATNVEIAKAIKDACNTYPDRIATALKILVDGPEGMYKLLSPAGFSMKMIVASLRSDYNQSWSEITALYVKMRGLTVGVLASMLKVGGATILEASKALREEVEAPPLSIMKALIANYGNVKECSWVLIKKDGCNATKEVAVGILNELGVNIPDVLEILKKWDIPTEEAAELIFRIYKVSLMDLGEWLLHSSAYTLVSDGVIKALKDGCHAKDDQLLAVQAGLCSDKKNKVKPRKEILDDITKILDNEETTE